MQNYSLEFILNIKDASSETIKNSLVEFGKNLEISALETETAKGIDFKIRITTEDPTIIFDTCSQFGRLKSVKID